MNKIFKFKWNQEWNRQFYTNSTSEDLSKNFIIKIFKGKTYYVYNVEKNSPDKDPLIYRYDLLTEKDFIIPDTKFLSDKNFYENFHTLNLKKKTYPKKNYDFRYFNALRGNDEESTRNFLVEKNLIQKIFAKKEKNINNKNSLNLNKKNNFILKKKAKFSKNLRFSLSDSEKIKSKMLMYHTDHNENLSELEDEFNNLNLTECKKKIIKKYFFLKSKIFYI